jgi:hypothetical protein
MADSAPQKRPKNAFLLFCEQIRPAVVANAPGRPAPVYSKTCGDMWRALSDEERAAYAAQAAELEAAFRKECPDYHYKRPKQSKQAASMAPKLANLDAMQLLNHMFQSNPLLLQQMLSERGRQGRPNVRKLFFPD